MNTTKSLTARVRRLFAVAIGACLALTLTSATALAQSGGPYTLTWSTIDGGGATLASTGGPYAVSGTIGAPDAGPPQVGGAFGCGGGYWNPTIAACSADFNGSGAVSVQDIFDFLAAYFASDPRADFNGSGTVGVQDIFDFLAAYFAGCN